MIFKNRNVSVKSVLKQLRALLGVGIVGLGSPGRGRRALSQVTEGGMDL